LNDQKELFMNEPVTTIDLRYSNGTTPTPWEETRHLLETAQLAWLSTVRADGRPHVTPAFPIWLDGIGYFTTAPGEQEVINLRGNPQMVFTTGPNTWNEGMNVVAEGIAAEVTDEDVLKRLAIEWTTKWDGTWKFQVRDGACYHPAGFVVLVFSITPSKIFAFANGPVIYGQTRHQF
jgi:general stress protein 26